MEETEKKDDDFALDKSAEDLYKRFAGIDDSDRVIHTDLSKSELIEQLNQEEKVLDYYRMLLAQTTCLFAGILANSRFSSLAKENEQKIKNLLHILKNLAKFPKFDGKIYCRLRGQQCPSEQSGSESYDYELSFGNFLLDYQMAQIVAQREKVKGAAIYSKLMEAFKTLSVTNIFNFSIDIGKGEDEDYNKIRNNILHLVQFFMYENTENHFIVHDEYGQPNINLTLLAATNKVPPEALEKLVNKIKPMILGPQTSVDLSRFTTVYDVIIASKNYRERIHKMPLEVNNVQWLTQTKTPQANPELAIKAVQVSRLVLEKYGNNPKMASEVLSSITREGYNDIKTGVVMGNRLSQATEFMNLAEKNEDKQSLQNDALENIEDGLEKISDEVYDNITISGNEVSSVNHEGQSTAWSFHENISDLLSFFKQRSATKKKVRDISKKQVHFDEEDFLVIARNFKISVKNASHLIDLLKACFDQNGHFHRNYFTKNITEFVQYDSKVFEFLWYYLKELSSREDRVSFLNALQILVGRLKTPQDALKILLADVFSHSGTVNFSDRNGLMLGSILLRKFNREEGSNIEITPEEVLLCHKGLNQEMIKVGLEFFEENLEYILKKAKIIIELMYESSAKEQHNNDEMKPRFLLYLQRELVIFIGLIGGSSAQAIIQGIVKEFGDPASSYYQTMKQKENLRHSLQLLQVATRALRRFEDSQSDSIFSEIANRKEKFIRLTTDPSTQDYIKRTIGKI
ncbi:MAG: hypothetical protein KKB30_11125 [Proteobacteria bacterium]|nr:hypothetical protein [Pseudomonadota bacterium]MBU1714319.1 hypothetical protein [Pseudomonadota bacterium]